MSPAPTPKFGLPRLGVTPLQRDLFAGNLDATHEKLCQLTLRTRCGSPFDRLVTESILRDWCEAAAQNGVSFGVRCSGDTLELYSTQGDSALAFAYALREVARWSRLEPELRQFDITFQRGEEVARALLSDTARASLRFDEPAAAKRPRSVAQVSDRADTPCHAITSLFEAAVEVERRVALETLEGNLEPSDVMVEMADLCAARIVEEELLLWKTGRAERARSLSRLRLSLGCVGGALADSSFRFRAANNDSG